MVVWVLIRFSLVCLLSLVQVSFFLVKLALNRMENFKNPRSGPPGPPQEEDRETQRSKKRFRSESNRTSTEPPDVKTPIDIGIFQNPCQQYARSVTVIYKNMQVA